MTRRDYPQGTLPAGTVWRIRNVKRAVDLARAARDVRLVTYGPRRAKYGCVEVQVECTPAQADAIERAAGPQHDTQGARQ